MKRLLFLLLVLVQTNSFAAIIDSLPSTMVSKVKWASKGVDGIAFRLPSHMEVVGQAPHFLHLYSSVHNFFFNVVNYSQIDARYKKNNRLWKNFDKMDSAYVIDKGDLRGMFFNSLSSVNQSYADTSGFTVLGKCFYKSDEYRFIVISYDKTCSDFVNKLCQSVAPNDSSSADYAEDSVIVNLDWWRFDFNELEFYSFMPVNYSSSDGIELYSPIGIGLIVQQYDQKRRDKIEAKLSNSLIDSINVERDGMSLSLKYYEQGELIVCGQLKTKESKYTVILSCAEIAHRPIVEAIISSIKCKSE